MPVSVFNADWPCLDAGTPFCQVVDPLVIIDEHTVAQHPIAVAGQNPHSHCALVVSSALARRG